MLNDVLNFWFGTILETEDYLTQRNQLWFSGTKETDEEIRKRFEATLREASAGKLDPWASTPRGRLALIIVLDQFARNIYRGTPAAFAQDAKALDLCCQGIERQEDRRLHPIERIFFYLPLEHAENLRLQEKSVALFTELSLKSPPTLKRGLESALEFAVRHYDVIRTFGRFPHRNQILGRPSIPEELAFLKAKLPS